MDLATGTRRHPGSDAFREYIDNQLGEHAHSGINGSGEEQAFVCNEALTNYWTRERITGVLILDDNTEADAEAIGTACLETFSILCYISCSAYFSHFTSLQINDGLLPIKQTNYSECQWSGDVGFVDALTRFCVAQWKFKPLVFDNIKHRKALRSECILPIAYDKAAPLTKPTNGELAMYKASVYPCCAGSIFTRNMGGNDLALKMLRSSDSHHWDNEVDAYTFLSRSSPDNRDAPRKRPLTMMAASPSTAASFNYITKYLGSFIITPPQGVLEYHRTDPHTAAAQRPDLDKTHVILVEHARGGNLTSFWQRHIDLVTSPKREDRVNLWHQMFHLLRALSAVHSIDGTHQGIQESNVLFMREDGFPTDREKACFKLTDFGKSQFKTPGGTGTGARVNHFDNHTYMAPECYETDDIGRTSSRPYRKAADIWSLGCLFSDMLVRSSLGREGVDRYREARVTANRQTIVRTYAPQCFHDGIQRLRCVDEFHQEALKKYPDDDVLRAVSDIILDHMLQQETARTDDALTIRGHWINRIVARRDSPAAALARFPIDSEPSPTPTISAQLFSIGNIVRRVDLKAVHHASYCAFDQVGKHDCKAPR
ncbi:kinase-like domain-containing protein [Chaetomium fimeti]|uniref:Kinase-like domain-containing protein n=1 Tax=Chaetomium fimeti TaxID=1854472 RepID=A0AAE0LMI1_9PEZI|nr:kinase-like domain-containing protein [Chaetomium fimeti]